MLSNEMHHYPRSNHAEISVVYFALEILCYIHQ